MANRSHTPITIDHLRVRDTDIMQALVMAGALVAVADGRVRACERRELVDFIDQKGLAPTISPDEIAEAFDDCVRQLGDRHASNMIMDSFRPLTGQSLASLVVRTAELVAAADRTIHPREVQAIKLLRLIMMSLQDRRPRVAARNGANGSANGSMYALPG